MEFKQEGKWWVSQTNFFEEVTKNFHFPDKIEILDTTLRDGEQEPGIIFTKEDKVAIAKKLDEAGVHRIEAGCPMTSDEDADAIRAICALGLKADGARPAQDPLRRRCRLHCRLHLRRLPEHHLR